MIDLPNKLSDLVDAALDDLEAVERDPAYLVDMEVFYKPGKNGVCHVCLAGAVMVRRLGIRPDKEMLLKNFGNSDTRGKLYALDYFAYGYISDALSSMGLYNLEEPDCPDWQDYDHTDPKIFKTQARAAAATLRAKGL